MSSLGFFGLLKMTYKVLEFKYEQRQLTTSINAIIKTPKGSLKGVKRLTIWGDAYYSFENVPYAKPPLGELRFRAPQPIEAWDSILDCTSPSEKPLQAHWLFRKYKGSEDCLYLNVFTKELTPEKKRPVMVWLYGGGFQIGEASRDMYSPDFFMTKDVVLVTVGYRLGAFGFLSLEDPTLDVPGNAGIKDQLLALQWVQENIEIFGGDPNNVTIFGESAGGASAHLCMLSERSKGLIHKSIVMSGSALCPWVRSPRNQWAYRLAQSLGYTGGEKDNEVFKFLRGCKGPDIVKATPTILSKVEKHHRILFAFGPVVEPYETEHCVIAEDPYSVMQKTWSNTIPMMIGGTSFEGLLFLPEVTRRPATLLEVCNCKNLLPADLELSKESCEREEYGLQLKKAYFGDEECNEKTVMNFLDLASYREFWHPIYRTILSRMANSQAPTYIYRFDYDSKEGNAIRNIMCGRNIRGSCHGDDLCYLYLAMYSYRPPKESSEYRMIQTMIDIWTSFAANSDPNCDMLGDVLFEQMEKGAELKCLNISEQSEFIELPELEKLKIWNGFYPKGKL